MFLATSDDASHAIPTYVDNVEAELIVDGDQYFTEVFDAIDATTPGDNVMIVGWTFDAGMVKGAHPAIGDLLAAKQLAGMKVHVVLNGSQYQNLPGTPFAQSLAALFDLRKSRMPPGATSPPLDQQVMFDFSGAPLTGSHHQKAIIVRQGGDAVAFIGGIDLWPDRDDTNDHPGTVIRKDGAPWGWHDAAVRIRGLPVADVWENFVSRWSESQTLPVRRAWRRTGGTPPVRLEPYNPSPGDSAPVPPATFTATTPNPDIVLQVLRSRYPIKLPREKPPLPWAFPPLGGIRQVYGTLHKAIGAAERYIYIEDQFIADTYDPDGGAAKAYSLLPDLLAAATRGVKIVLVTSGKADGPTVPALPPRTMQNKVIDLLPAAKKTNISIWKLENLMVHSKLVFIDDVFCGVGSANLHSRSMYGIDQELHVAVVDAAVDAAGNPQGVVRDWRVRLWAEHLEILGHHAPVLSQLQDLDLALGMWRQSWRIGGTPDMWFVSDNPPGFNPTRIRRIFVGPLPNP